MSNTSNYYKENVINHLLRTSTFSKPSTVVVGLTGNVLTDTEMADVSGQEIANAGSYARVDLGAPADGDWDAIDYVNGSGHTENTAEIAFPVATASWGWVSGVFLADSTTWGTGNIILKGQLTTPKLVSNGDQLKFNAETMDIYFA